MAKNKIKALFFWAAWDSNISEKIRNFRTECDEFNIPNALIDVETENGVNASVMYGVRNVPAIVILKDGRCVGVERGNHAYENLHKYVK